MKGIITININDHKVEFDFENYRYGVLYDINETVEDRLRIGAEIENNKEYKLLRKCLIAKHEFEKTTDSDPQKYKKALDEFTDWCMERHEGQEKQSV